MNYAKSIAVKSRIKEITKLILGSFAIYFVMAACASGSIRQGFKDLADAASDGNINGVGDALSELADAATGYSDVSFISPVDAAKAESGSRLKRVQIQGDDGSIADQFAFFDSQRNEDCYYTQTTSDYRCLPLNSIGGSFYSDGNCTNQIFAKPPDKPSPNYLISSNNFVASNIYERGSSISTPVSVYSKNGQACSALQTSYLPGYEFFAKGPEVPLSDFQRGVLTHE